MDDDAFEAVATPVATRTASTSDRLQAQVGYSAFVVSFLFADKRWFPLESVVTVSFVRAHFSERYSIT